MIIDLLYVQKMYFVEAQNNHIVPLHDLVTGMMVLSR